MDDTATALVPVLEIFRKCNYVLDETGLNPRPICHFYGRQKTRCRQGDTCPFYHIRDAVERRERHEANRTLNMVRMHIKKHQRQGHPLTVFENRTYAPYAGRDQPPCVRYMRGHCPLDDDMCPHPHYKRAAPLKWRPVMKKTVTTM